MNKPFWQPAFFWSQPNRNSRLFTYRRTTLAISVSFKSLYGGEAEEDGTGVRHGDGQPPHKVHQKLIKRDYPGGPVAKTLCSQRRGLRFNPWSKKKIPHITAKSLNN